MSLTTQQVGEQLRKFLSEHTPREPNGPVVLIWEMGGFPALLRKNAILAAALRLRGCRPHMIICDGTPLGCIRRGVEENDPLERWQHRCSTCSLKCAQMAETYGVPFSRVGDYLTQDARDHFRQLADAIRLEDVLGFSHRGVAVGQLAWSSLNRYLKGYSFTVADLPAEYAAIYRQYFYAAIANTEAAARAMQQLDPASVLTSHGVYADYAPALALAHLQGRAAMSWASGYADCLHYFTVPQDSNRVVVRGLSERVWLKRAAEPLTADEEALLDNFLHERYFKQGARDIEILSAPKDAGPLKRTLGIANNRPIVCLFAHVNWDACFDFSTMIFPTANDWVIESIRKMIALPDVNWIIRVHPGEIIDGSVFSTGDIIKQHFPQLPDHIKILWADSEVNSFGLYRLIDAGITIFGTVGAELTAMGKPVIVAGESHYSGKGFTQDAHSHSEYLQMLEQCSVMTPLTGEQTKLARQYAFSFFIQRQIPIRLTEGHMGDLDPGKMSLLLPGQDAVMGLICDHILDGEDIILEGASQPTLEVAMKTDMPQHDPRHQLVVGVLQHLNLQTPAQKDEIVRKIVANDEPGLLAANLKAPQNRMRDFASVDDLVGTIASYVQGDLEEASLRRVLAFIEEAELLNTSRKSVLDIGCGKGLFAFISRKILGHEVVTTSHLTADPFFYEFIRTRVYGLETPLHWAIDKSGSLPPQIASRSFDCVALHSFSGHGHDKPDALKWQASDWLRFLGQLHTLLNPHGRLQLRHIAFGEGILEELKKSLESEPCFKILKCDVDNGGDKVWYQATGPQTVWGLTLQKTGPRFAIKVPQGAGSVSRITSSDRDQGTTSTQLQLEAFGRFEGKDWSGALHLFDKALALQPAQGIHLMRARCLLSLQQPTQAKGAIEAELKLNPNHPDALQLLGELSPSQHNCQSGAVSSVANIGPRFAITVPGSLGTTRLQSLSNCVVNSAREVSQDQLNPSGSSGKFSCKAPMVHWVPAPPTSESAPTVSVVIPTYNRAKMLGITLESFVNQHYPKNRFEIVVADNNSSDETRQVVEEWQRRSAVPVKYVFEKRQGVHYARNTAAWQTSGEILYYTDDDMIADCELLAEIVKPFSMDPRVGSATGRILPQWEVPPPDWIRKLCNNFRLSLNDLGEQMLIQEKDPGVYSCHMAMRRGIFFQSGGFNPENTAGEWIGDGETGLNIKIKELGYKFAYNGKAVIRHMIPPQRMTQEHLNKRLANQGNCDSYTDYKKHRYSEKQLIERIAEHQAKIAEHSAHYAASRLNNDLHWRLDRAFIDYYLNRVEYDHRLIHDAQWRELVLRYDWLNEGMPEQCEGKERAFVSPLDEIRRSLEVLNGALA